jgi:hypothetical protein
MGNQLAPIMTPSALQLIANEALIGPDFYNVNIRRAPTIPTAIDPNVVPTF